MHYYFSVFQDQLGSASTVADYRKDAEECSMAANPEDKKVFEDMAQNPSH
jgi:hypothetical protein